MNVLFRADSSFAIGTGHIMRDLVLANKYKNKGYNIHFVTLDLKGNINSKIIDSGFSLINLESNDINELCDIVNRLKIDLLVIDHYKIDYNVEKSIKEKTSVKILSFDDTYERHYSDIILNHNVSADAKKYTSLVPEFCELRCGPKFTLLRDEFYEEKKKQKTSTNSIKNILIALGGSDTFEMNIKVLKSLKYYDNYYIKVVTTSANTNLEKLKKYIYRYKNIKLYINSNKIASLINESDLVIVTPSVILNEVIFMKKPFIAIKVVENQQFVSDFFAKKGFFVIEKNNLSLLRIFFEKMNLKSIRDKMYIKLRKFKG